MNGMACRTHFFNQFIVRTVNEIIDGNNTDCVAEGRLALMLGMYQKEGLGRERATVERRRPPRDPNLVARFRAPRRFSALASRTKKYQSFINFGLLNYQ